jgi:outer membrane receptor protein involved in Fe transport
MQNNITNSLNINMTRVQGTHTLKGGFMLYHNLEWDGRSNMQGTYNFGNDSANPLDSQFGYANAALGVFSSITQTKRWTEGADNARNIEWYVQDNWRTTRRLTLDYGLRFVSARAVFDQLGQGSNFLPKRINWQRTGPLSIRGANGVPVLGYEPRGHQPAHGYGRR